LNLPLNLKAFSSASQPRTAKKFNRLGTNSGGINLLFRQFKVVLFGLRFRVALRDCQNTCLRIIFKERFNKFNVAIYEPTEILVMKRETKKERKKKLVEDFRVIADGRCDGTRIRRIINQPTHTQTHKCHKWMSDYTANWIVGNRDVYLRRHSSQFCMQKAATFSQGSEEKAFL